MCIVRWNQTEKNPTFLLTKLGKGFFQIFVAFSEGHPLKMSVVLWWFAISKTSLKIHFFPKYNYINFLTKIFSLNFSGTTVLVSYQPLLKVPWLLTVWSFNTWASIWWTKRLWKRSSKPKPRSKLTTRKILIAAAPEVQQLPHYPKPEIVLKMENLKANLRKNVKHSCLLLDSRPLRNRNWSNDDPVRKVVKAWIYFHVEIPPNLPWPKTRQITTISLPIWSRPAITLSHLDAEMKLKK